MNDSSIRINRSELYKKVWSQSVSSLAKEMGISDIGLAKICKRHNIPRPGLGYWAKRQTGLKVQQEPLPKGDDERIIVRKVPGHIINRQYFWEVG